MRDLASAERYLETLINLERRSDWPYQRMGLEPIRRLLAALDHPERPLRVFHIAGSKGKGSTALMIEALLCGLGASVGTYTSPHLETFRERFRLNGTDVEAETLTRAVARLRPHIDRLRAETPENAPSFFDALTAIALVIFRDAALRYAILEVGLGGRLDSTNAIPAPLQTCVTSIELEHTDKLGDTRSAIAREKAGILKPGVPVVLGSLPPDARAVVLERASELRCPVDESGRDFFCESAGSVEDAPLSTRFVYRDARGEVRGALPFGGAHQIHNAGLALACVRRALGEADERTAEVAGPALASLALPGRVELLSQDPLILVDSAHTVASAEALATTLRALPHRELHFVVSLSAGKDLRGILESWLPLATRITVTHAEATRSLAPNKIVDALRAIEGGRDLDVRVIPDPERALRSARESQSQDELLCATGSVYLAGIARRVWGKRRR